MASESSELVVIGAGPGGYAAAFLAADLGMETVLVDPEPNPGGVCLYRGCIPSKALLHAAAVIAQAKEAERWGIAFSGPSIDVERLRAWKDSVVEKLTGGLGVLRKRRKIEYLRGRARFRDAGTVEIEPVSGQGSTLSFRHAILATGSGPSALGNLPVEHERFMNSERALDLRDVPERLLVVGAGYIGLEMSSVYGALGSRITVVEMTDGILPGVDRDLVRPLGTRLKGALEAILLGTVVAEWSETDHGVRVRFEGKQAPSEPMEFDRILVSVGRKPCSGGLGLENTRVQLTQGGFVRVNGQRQSDEPSIYAVGDVAGQPMLAHKASHEGRTAVQAISGRRVMFDPRAIPAVVFTEPEIAWCGLTEVQAKREGREIKVSRFPWSASGRAATLDHTDGVTKLVLEPGTDRVLGVGLAGTGAGELIAEGVLAVEMGACAEDLSLSIHPHPTLSETVMEAAEALYGLSTHYHRPAAKG
ncbi:MAG: dihydrolipoyl dehydrogenase [bacterium]